MKALSIFWDNANRWAVRMPVLAAVAILICTLFPFQFFLQDTSSRRAVSFLLWLEPYPDGFRDFTENIILFMPFGFGWACWACQRRWKQPWVWTTAFAAGAGLSYMVEFLQVFLPTRGPSWWDVLSNTIGTLVGFSLFAHVGKRVLDFAARLESFTEMLATTRRIIVAFVTYATLTLVISALVQRSITSSNWQPGSAQLMGPQMNGRHMKRARLSRLEITDHIFAAGSARGSASEKQLCTSLAALGLLPEATAPAMQKLLMSRHVVRAGVLPWSPDETANIVCLSGQEWQQTPLPIGPLVKDIQKTHTFTLRIIYAPADALAAGRIVSISDNPQDINLDLVQEGRVLTVWLRTGVLGVSRYWSLNFPDTFQNGQPKEIFLTFDGAELVGYLDGKKNVHSLRLNPGAALVYRLKGVNPYHVRGYEILYMMMVFVPLGVFLRFGVQNPAGRNPSTWILIGAAILVPPLLQEGVLSSASGCPFHFESMILGCCLIAGAFLL